MTVLNPPPLAIAEENIPNAPKRRRATVVRGSRPGWFVYSALAVVLGSAIFPFYWSFLVAMSGRRYRTISSIPGSDKFDIGT